MFGLEQFRLARLYTDVGQHRHKALTERLELLPRVPDLADAEVAVRTEGDVVLEPVRRPVAGVIKTAEGFVVLLRSHIRGVKRTRTLIVDLHL